MAFQTEMSNPANPDSVSEGMSGNAAMRAFEVTPKALALPARIFGRELDG
jgi:hypothetical protein